MKQEHSGQRARLLTLLLRTPGEWVSIRDIIIGERMLQYSARIRELRKEGHRIENKVEREINSFGEKVKHGFFRILPRDDYE